MPSDRSLCVEGTDAVTAGNVNVDGILRVVYVDTGEADQESPVMTTWTIW
jgi:hypothetical protein